MSDTGKTRKAGDLLLWLLTDPTGEEVTEGVLGGLIAGGGMLASDQSLEQTALQTLTAMAGGVGLGMAGRRIGRSIGNRVHAGPLKNQTGVLAGLARTMGSEEGTAKGFGQQTKVMRSAIEESLVQQKSYELADEALSDPAAFEAKYGVSPDDFLQTLPSLMEGRAAMQAFNAYRDAPAEDRKRILEIVKTANAPSIKRYTDAEDLLTAQASQAPKEALFDLADLVRGEGDLEARGVKASDAIEQLAGVGNEVTGGDVGQFLGRFIGDEVGITTGLITGGMLANALGIQSPKDKKIAELEKQLAAQRQ